MQSTDAQLLNEILKVSNNDSTAYGETRLRKETEADKRKEEKNSKQDITKIREESKGERTGGKKT